MLAQGLAQPCSLPQASGRWEAEVADPCSVPSQARLCSVLCHAMWKSRLPNTKHTLQGGCFVCTDLSPSKMWKRTNNQVSRWNPRNQTSTLNNSYQYCASLKNVIWPKVLFSYFPFHKTSFLADFCSLIFYGCIHCPPIICRAISSISNAKHYALL